MNKRLITQLMHGRVNSLLSSGPYYFRSDFDHVLQGLCFEYVPRGVYIWRFCFPLFDFAGLNLTFSERLCQQKGFVAKGAMSEEAIVDFAMSSPEAQSVFDRNKSIDLPEFIHGIESLPYDWHDTHAALIYAASLVLTGQDVQRATRMLDKLAAASVLGPRALAGCNRLRESLHQGLEPARALLDQVRQENMRTLGLARGG